MQYLGARQSLVLNPAECVRGGRPLDGGALVAADVDMRCGEDIHDLFEDGAAEVQGQVVDAEGGVAHAPIGPYAQTPFGAVAQLGIGGDGHPGMSGHPDLGHDRDAPQVGVRDEFAELPTGVAAAVRRPVVHPAARGADHRLGPVATDLGEFGVGRDRHSPALVVGEVQLQDVELVEGQQVHVAAYEGDRLEVAGHIEHRSTPEVAWGIRDLDAGKLPGTAALRGVQQGFGWKQLADGLDAVQESGFVCGSQEQGVRSDAEPVGLVSEAAQLRVEKEA